MNPLLPAFLIALVPLAALAQERVYLVEGDSMKPALAAGDQVVVESNLVPPPARGGIVAIKLRTSPTPMVKRVLATPGDRIGFGADSVWVNGTRVASIDLPTWRSTIRQMEFYAGVVPDGLYLVLGDNQLNSKDSGKLGLISSSQLLGKVTRVLKASPEASARLAGSSVPTPGP
jgi:signal peptidase I